MEEEKHSYDWRPETAAIRHQLPRTAFQEHSVPLYLSSSFVFDDAEDMRASFAEEKDRMIYSRYGNPNNAELVKKVCVMEGAEAGYSFASGMSAVFSTLAALLESGDRILACQSVFGSTLTLFETIFPKWGIQTDYFDTSDTPEAIASKITPQTRLVYLESPTNPGVDLIDLESIGQLCAAHKILMVVDNCFATPYLQQPLRYGAHLSVHSGTKLMDGQGRVLGGIVIGDEELVDRIYRFSRISGPALSPFHAWLLSKSLETLAVRVDRHCANALEIAQRLEQHPKVAEVRYPYLPSHPKYAIAQKQMKAGGPVVAFDLKGGLLGGKTFFDQLAWISLSANLGDSRTIATHPASTTHSKLDEKLRLQLGIKPGTVRVSVGLEHVEDIWKDMEQAFSYL